GWETTSGEPAVILAEGVFDWLTLQRWRLPAIGLGGTHASSRLVDALQRFERVYVAFDNDPAGREATQRLTERLGHRAIPISLPAGFKDVSDLGLDPDGRLLLVRTLEESGSGHMALSTVTGRESVSVPEQGVAA
ncbi:MAG: toprim domain-containing protein, partial [Chloroflexota bacterium]